MADEKIFTIPLREAYLKGRKERAKKASAVIKEFLARHMKSDDIKIGLSINNAVWARGMQKPPRRVRVHALKDGEAVYAELVGTEIKLPSKEDKKKKEEKAKAKEEKIKEERKERRKQTIQEELEEKPKSGAPSEEKPAEKKPEAKAEGPDAEKL
ncbi:MAG: 50S ribosomal protein L31e [Candidatus Aenigmatarchaeota archaeon]